MLLLQFYYYSFTITITMLLLQFYYYSITITVLLLLSPFLRTDANNCPYQACDKALINKYSAAPFWSYYDPLD